MNTGTYADTILIVLIGMALCVLGITASAFVLRWIRRKYGK